MASDTRLYRNFTSIFHVLDEVSKEKIILLLDEQHQILITGFIASITFSSEIPYKERSLMKSRIQV